MNEEYGKQSGWARQGHDGDAQREISGAQRSGGHGRRGGWCAQRDGYEGGCGVGELRLCGTPY